MKKLALVTGGNRGLGKELCMELAEEDWQVILTARDIDKAREACEELAHVKANIETHQLDVTDLTSINELARYIDAKYGKLDALVNNAAIMASGHSTLDVDIDAVKSSLETNVYGPLMISQQLMPLLAKANGKIINVSSGMGSFHEMYGGYAAYRLSKTALNSLTAVMANDARHLGVKVFAVCPGWVRTDMGGQSAPRSLEEGVAGIKWLVTQDQGESGKFYRDKKQIKF